ncbi:MAG: hypothetical protein IID40_00700 [Planctomycetes bacterium]|nr:hypothetical protein [Planctomycetota bacterium]
MEQWMIITGLLVGAAGTILFLRLIADEVSVFERTLEFHQKLQADHRAREPASPESAG